MKNKLKEMWSFPTIGLIHEKNNYYYFDYNPGKEKQNKLYKVKKRKSYKLDPTNISKGTEIVFDPKKVVTNNHTLVHKSIWSQDGKYFVYEVDNRLEQWNTLRVRCLNTGKDLNDSVKFVKFPPSVAWTKDNKGFFYSKFDLPKGGVINIANVKDVFKY